MSKTTLIILVFAVLLFALPVISGQAAATPESLETIILARWLSSIVQFWVDLTKELLRQIKL